jgi:hypothetical protein
MAASPTAGAAVLGVATEPRRPSRLENGAVVATTASSHDPATGDVVKRRGSSAALRALAGSSPSTRSNGHGLSSTHRISARGRVRWRRVLTEAQEVRVSDAARRGGDGGCGEREGWQWGNCPPPPSSTPAAPLLAINPLLREQGWSGT